MKGKQKYRRYQSNQARCGSKRRLCAKNAFTLVELLIVIGIIALLLSLVLPALASAKAQARSVVCRSNLHQLWLANHGYALDNNDFYVPAAADFWTSSGGTMRWHGVRNHPDQPFDPLKGPLADYLGDGQVKHCPENIEFAHPDSWNAGFEKGCGGYGYNMTYIGSTIWKTNIKSLEAYKNSYRHTTQVQSIRYPFKTLMFADSALVKSSQYIEYSFAEPPHPIYNGKPYTKVFMSPTIHFRHREKTNVVWANGSISSLPMAPLDQDNAYGMKSRQYFLGWFDPVDNSLFDLQ